MNVYTAAGAAQVLIAIHWDTTKTVDDGAGTQIPDPAYVEWYQFGGAAQKPAGQTNNAYIGVCQSEAKALARLVRQAANKAARKATDFGVPTVDNS